MVKQQRILSFMPQATVDKRHRSGHTYDHQLLLANLFAMARRKLNQKATQA